jgi:hypothetical protein
MAFAEPLKLEVKKKADFTCCWCQDRRNKVDVHHIVPKAEGGSDDEDNAAPLCGSCHDLYGANPVLRKEIRCRRDRWYEVCSRTLNPDYGWPIGLDVPLLSFSRPVAPTRSIPTQGIQLTDSDPTDATNPPLLYLSVHFKTTPYFGDHLPPGNELWLYLEASMRFAFNLRIQVRAWSQRDVDRLMAFLSRGDQRYLPDFMHDLDEGLRAQYLTDLESGWGLFGPAPDNAEYATGDYMRVWRENDENRIHLTTFTSTRAGLSIHGRLTDNMMQELATYLEESGFTNTPGT